MTEHMLSTEDNPYHPFLQFDQWDAWDRAAGYHTLAYQARVVRTSGQLSEADESLAIEQAIDEIIEMNLLGIYVKIPKPVDADETIVE